MVIEPTTDSAKSRATTNRDELDDQKIVRVRQPCVFLSSTKQRGALTRPHEVVMFPVLELLK